ncbi:MAG: peptidylprolyl isomerase [Cyanobacteria bacterium J06648_10]
MGGGYWLYQGIFLVTSDDEPNTETTEDPLENQFISLPRLEGEAQVELIVNGSPIVIQIDGTQAPITAGNFVDLVEKGVYDELTFHRVVQSPEPFVVQGGDPQSKDPEVPTSRLGTGGYADPSTGEERTIPLEILPAEGSTPVYLRTFQEAEVTEQPAMPHRRGAVAMARSGVNTASSQFYIALADLDFLDGEYAVFGYVTEGMDAVDNIQMGDKIESARVVEGSGNLKPGVTSAAD